MWAGKAWKAGLLEGKVGISEGKVWNVKKRKGTLKGRTWKAGGQKEEERKAGRC